MNVNFDIKGIQAISTKPPKPVIKTKGLDFAYGDSQALFNISMDIFKKEVTAFIGPSGCGKSTLLRCFNRMNDLIETAKIKSGNIRISDIDIYNKDVDVIAGVATGAIGIGILVAEKLNLPFIYVRPEAKKHGRQNQIEGEVSKGKKIIVIEDLIMII